MQYQNYVYSSATSISFERNEIFLREEKSTSGILTEIGDLISHVSLYRGENATTTGALNYYLINMSFLP